MRATFGNLAVVLLLVLSICGCKSTSNMFDWGKKKPSSTLAEAPPYKSTNPALPSAGQTPPAIAARTAATGATANSTASAASSGSTSNAYSSLAAGYQQSPYPTTPFAQSKVSSSSGAMASAAPAAASAAATSPSASPSTSAPYNGYASAVGTGNALPPPAAYKPAATANASSSQPQNGFYNPAYGGAGSTSAPTAYASAAAANPAYNYNSSPASGATASAMPPASSAGQTSEIRVADVRGGAGAAPSAQVAIAGSAPAATITNNPTVGDRYSNMNATGSSNLTAGSSNLVGDRYGAPQATGAASASSIAPIVSAPPAAAAAPPAQASTNDYYRPTANAPEAASGYSAPDAANSSAAPTSNSAPSDSPLRKDSGYRPGGTSDYAPGGNVLRPDSTNSSGGSPQSNSRPAKGVMPVSFQSSASPSPSAPVVASAAAPPADRYRDTSAISSAEPAYGASSPLPSQQGAYPDHSW